MNPHFPSDGLSNIPEFQQCPDGTLYVEGLDGYGKPLTQVGGTPHSQFSTESNDNTSFSYQLTREAHCQDLATWGVRPGRRPR